MYLKNNKTIEGVKFLLPLLFFIVLSIYLNFFYFNTSLDSDLKNLILNNIRIPKFVGALVVGSSLAVAAYIFQNILNNPLADPYTLGISSGSSTFVAVYLIFFSHIKLLNVNIAAFLGASSVILVFYFLLKILPKNNLIIILIGIGISFFYSSIIIFLLSIMQGSTLIMMHAWLIGSLENIEINKVYLLFSFLSLVLLYAQLNYKILNALKMGSDFSITSGINYNFYLLFFLFIAATLTALSVSLAGPIGFVGLLVPHLLNLIIPSYLKKIKIILTAILGAIFLSFCNGLSIVFSYDYDISVGVFSSFMGSIVLIYLIFRKYNARNL